MRFTSEEITDLIQTIKKGIDLSNVGPLYVYGNNNAEGNPTKIFSPIAFETFKIILSESIKKMDKVEYIPNEEVIEPTPSSLILESTNDQDDPDAI